MQSMKRLVWLVPLLALGLAAQSLDIYGLMLSRNIREGGDLGPVVMSVAQHFKLRPSKEAAAAFSGALKRAMEGRNLADGSVDRLATGIVGAIYAASVSGNSPGQALARVETLLATTGTSLEDARAVRDRLGEVCGMARVQ